ncbi:MAG: hypothetical protein KF723_03210 [Rhizobiaceae bacterium]|nr:hypothetical protein [Rhizobiaceae bacterium]
MARTNCTSRTTLALVAALVLVVQTTLALVGAATRADAMMLDAFGNPLCITSSDDGQLPEGSSPAGDHGTATNCCALGCVSGTAPLVPAADQIGLPRPLVSARLALSVASEAPSPQVDHAPGSPRAPPLLA